MTAIGIEIHRIDADPVDCPMDEILGRLAKRGLHIHARTWQLMTGFLPADRQRTRVRLNQKNWPSASEYLAAMADSEPVSSFIQKLPPDGWVDRREDWEAAELHDHERVNEGGERMLDWHRPVVRLGVHVRLTSGTPLPDDAADRIIKEFGDVLVIELGAHEMAFALRGAPQDVESRLATALGVPHAGPRW